MSHQADAVTPQADAAAPKVGIIVGTTRPGNKARAVAGWIKDIAARRDDASFEVVDIADFDLPHLDEPKPARSGEYTQPHTRAWAERIGSFDAFVFVTPEYNGSYPGVLKSALDFLYAEWAGKAAAVVGYGFGGGSRATEQLRTLLGNLELAAVPSGVALTFNDDFEEMTRFAPSAGQEKNVAVALDELISKIAELKESAGTE